MLLLSTILAWQASLQSLLASMTANFMSVAQLTNKMMKATVIRNCLGTRQNTCAGQRMWDRLFGALVGTMKWEDQPTIMVWAVWS